MISYFFAVEQSIRSPSNAGMTYSLGHGTRSHGTLQMLEGGGTVTNDAIIYASDSGYCSRPTDPGGPQAYPPRVQEAFAVDALVNLDPTQSAVGASWGSIVLANNDSKYDSILNGGWIADSLPTKILYGNKTLEAFDGYATARAASATRIDPTNTMQLVNPATLRQDYAGAIAIDANATNVIRNSVGGGSVAGTLGSGGVMPSGWTVNVPGLTTTISNYRCTLPGLGAANVIRLRFFGTTTAASGSVSYGTTGSMSGLLFSQPVAQSLYLARVAGAFTGITQITHYLALYDATAAAIVAPQPNFMPSITTTLTRLFRTYSTPATGNQPWATGNPSIIFYWPTQAVIDFTIDIAAPQLERGTVPTDFIATTAGDVTHGDGNVNYIPTSDMTSAVVGTPGTLPNGWSVNLGTGISQQVVATGTDATTGYKTIDVRFFGTATSTLTNLHFCSAIIDACQNQAWTMSVYACLVAGTQTGISFTLGLQETDTGGAFLAFAAETGKPLNTNVIWRSRRIAPVVTAQANTRYISPSLWITYTSGAAIDFTMRLMAPQCEGGTVASSFIPTTTAAVARAATYTITDTPTTLDEPAATNYVRSTQVPAVANVTIAASTDVPAIYAGVPIWKHTRTTTGADSNTGTLGVTGLPATGGTLRGSAWLWIPSSFASTRTFCGFRLEGAVTNAALTNANLTLLDQWQQVSFTATLTAPNTSANIVLRILTQVAGDVVYTSAWQLEMGAATTSFIPPATTPAVRDADALYMARNVLVDPPYASLVPAFNGVAGTLASDDTKITIPLRDASYWLERPLVRSTYGGGGQYDGTAALTGSLKPLVIGGGQGQSKMYGPVNNVTPVLIDPPALIYQVSDGAIGKLAQLYEGGKGGGWAFAGDVADLYGGSTPAGSYRTCLARGCFQLGSTPTYPITCDVNGATLPGTPAPVSPDTLAVAAYALKTLCGVPDNLLAMQANGNLLDTVGATPPVSAGCALFLGPGDTIDGLTLLTRILAPIGAKLVACRDGLLRAFAITALPPHPTIKAALDDRTIVSIVPIALPSGVSPTPYRMRVGYNDNYTIQTSDLSPLVDATRKQYLATAQSSVQSNAPTINYAAFARTNDPPIISGSIVDAVLNAQVSAQASADAYIKLWGARRRLYGITIPFTIGIGLEYGDVVSVTTDAGDLSGTLNAQVVGYSYRSEDSSITLRLLI